jgi:hypothetical protein
MTWAPLTPDGFIMYARTEGTQTLLSGPPSPPNQEATALIIDPAKDDPELWLGNPEPSSFDNAQPTSSPSWAQKPVWPRPAGQDVEPSFYGFRGDDLFGMVIRWHTTKEVELLWYQRGVTDPVRIPLDFEMNEADSTALKADFSTDSFTVQRIMGENSSPGVINMIVVPQGICFWAIAQGFWFIPFTDIDSYLKTHPVPQRPPGNGPNRSDGADDG